MDIIRNNKAEILINLVLIIAIVLFEIYINCWTYKRVLHSY